MPDFIKIKDILNNFSSGAEEKPRGTHHEFQDFAYRIAVELNDLNHLGIYMRMVKNTPRFILEEAYQFVIDSKIENKGALFMWKFKKLKNEIQLKKNLNNFELNFVLKKIRDLREKFSKKILEEIILPNELGENFSELIRKELVGSKLKVLCLNIDSIRFLNELPFDINQCSIDVLENANSLLKQGKFIFKNYKFIKKDFFSKVFKTKFDLIIIGNYFRQLPVEAEIEFLEKLKTISKEQAFYIFQIQEDQISSQKWILKENSENPVFVKKTNIDNLNTISKALQMGFVEDLKGENSTNIFLKSIISSKKSSENN